jgi:hypothetical protein
MSELAHHIGPDIENHQMHYYFPYVYIFLLEINKILFGMQGIVVRSSLLSTSQNNTLSI